MSRLAALLLSAALVAGAGCTTQVARGSSRPVVDATVAPIADIVRQVVGDNAEVVALIPEGVDSHTFEASPETVKSLAKADILFMDGLHLEGSILKQARTNMRKGSKIVELGNETIKPDNYAYDFTFPKSKGDPNPHLWMDPTYAKHFAEIVRDTMVGRDAKNASSYRTNYDRFAALIDRLDNATRASIDSIPVAQRKLLTYHDSFAYFSRRYNIAVLGAIQPSDFSEPSPREVQALITQVKHDHVPAIFGSEVFPSTVLAEVARESGARYITKLRDDELPGKPGTKQHTYVGMMVDDVTVMTKALGGNAAPMAAVLR